MMRIKKEALLHDISQIAYVIADMNGEIHKGHGLHQLADICQEGNIDRVARIMGLAYAEIRLALSPLLKSSIHDSGKDISAIPQDLVINFRKNYVDEVRLRLIREAAHEFIVAKVMADWLGITLPSLSGEWKNRAGEAFMKLELIATSVMASRSMRSFSGGRPLPPI